MNDALRCVLLLASAMLVGGCAVPGESRQARYERETRASDTMAPDNPARGTRTMRVTTRKPPELEVRLVTFYSQFHPQMNSPAALVPRGGKVAEGCWWSRTSLLQEERYHYTRVFRYPVAPGTATQDLVLDEVVPGTCNLGITGIGYDVVWKRPDGTSVTSQWMTYEVAVEEGSATSGRVTVQCGEVSVQAGAKPQFYCRHERKDNPGYFVGPLAPTGAELTLDFRLTDAAMK